MVGFGVDVGGVVDLEVHESVHLVVVVVHYLIGLILIFDSFDGKLEMRRVLGLSFLTFFIELVLHCLHVELLVVFPWKPDWLL